ncbi:hypothetical protein HYS10_00830 [Candidatus Collierbacteria bacterium]|nr:hypothetical protein [Candidatus Collierbacteria bacterium]
MKTKTSLIFVYNLKSSPLDQIIDEIHRRVAPHTYPCRLCFITYDTLGMKKEWKDFLNNLPYPIKFFHKDQFLQAYQGTKFKSFPAIFKEEGEKLTQIVDVEEILPLKDLSELKSLVLARVWSGKGRSK